MLKLNVIIIALYILERLLELVVSARNKRLLKKDISLKVLNQSESNQMKLFHGCWFMLLIAESTMVGIPKENLTFYIVAIVLVLAQALRWISIYTLGKYWSVDVYEMKEHARIINGPYAYIKHPNYMAVVIEFFFLPLLLACPVTLVVGSLANLFILKRRIKMEERALNLQAVPI